MINAGGKFRIGLVQVSSSFANSYYLPNSVGCLKAYAQKHLQNPGTYTYLPLIYRRIPLADLARQLAGADLVGFSSYIWNEQYSLAAARHLKETHPQTVIVFGGPQVPREAQEFLRDHPFIDLVCHDEGEKVFCAILENLGKRQWGNVPGISFLAADGTFVKTSPMERIVDLSELPSALLDGVFDGLMDEEPQANWLLTWETNRGCPYHCTFCTFSPSLGEKLTLRDMDTLRREIDWFAQRKVDLVYCADANFGILARDMEIAKYCHDTKKRTGYPRAVLAENAKNLSEGAYQAQRYLQKAGLATGAVISMQTLNTESLKSIKRDNIPIHKFYEFQKRCAEDDISTMTDLILGLPEESYDSFVDGVATVIDNGQHHKIQFNNLIILSNAELAGPECEKKYQIETVDARIVNQHGLALTEEIIEIQKMVVGTLSMPTPDWISTRAFCWMTSFLYFDKILQIPLLLVRQLSGIGYRELIELFMAVDPEFPVLCKIRDFLRSRAEALSQGDAEYCYSREWLGLWWPVNEYVLIDLYLSNQLDEFYAEAQRALSCLLIEKNITLPLEVLSDAIRLNRAALKLPFQFEDEEVSLSSNLYDFYSGIIMRRPVELMPGTCKIAIRKSLETWDSHADWMRRVVWYQNRVANYLHKMIPVKTIQETVDESLCAAH